MTGFLLAVFFMLGIFLIVREVVLKGHTQAESEARARLRELMKRANPDWAEEAGVDEPKKSRRERINESSPVLEGVTSWLQGSNAFENKEGRDFISWLERQLVLAGLQRKYTPYQALALTLTMWTVGIVLPTMLVLMGLPKLIYVIAVGAAIAYPPMKLISLKKQRLEALRSEVPWLIHELSMALATEALTLQEGLARVTRAYEPGAKRSPLLEEFAQAVLEVRMGARDWEHAMMDVIERTQVLEVATFVDTLVSANRTGDNIIHVLDQYAEAATDGWAQDTLAFINKQEPKFMIGMVLIIFGIMAWFAAPIVIGAFASFSGGH